MRILVVEDDPMIGAAVEAGLRQQGHAVDWARDGTAAELALGTGEYAMVLLDLGLPRKGGLEVLKSLRTRGGAVPVLIITARDAVGDRVLGLNLGADDYVAKPFELDELVARIGAVARRHAGRAEPLIVYGEIALNPVTREVTSGGKTVVVSGREFALLEALLERPGAVLSRAQLETRLYGWNEEVESNSVEVHIHNLRRKLGANAILNLRGVGYFASKTK